MKKQRLIKRVIGIGVAAAMTISLFGCSGGAQDATTVTTEDCCASKASEDQPDNTDTDSNTDAASLQEKYGLNPEVETLTVGVESVSPRAVAPAIALGMGYFEEEGLDAEFAHLDSVGAIVSSLITDKVDVCTFAASPEINSIAAGNDLVFIGGTGNADQYLYVRKENEASLQKPEDFYGKKVGTAVSSPGRIGWRTEFEDAGLDYPGEIEFVELDDQNAILQAISKGELDAGFLVEEQRDAAEKLGLVVVRDCTSEICCRVTVRRDSVENDRSALLKYTIAVIRAYELYETDPDKATQLVADYSQLDPEIVKNVIFSKGFVTPDPNTKGIESLYNNGHALGLFDEIEDIDSHIDTTIYEDALEILLERDPENAVYQELAAQHEELN